MLNRQWEFCSPRDITFSEMKPFSEKRPVKPPPCRDCKEGIPIYKRYWRCCVECLPICQDCWSTRN